MAHRVKCPECNSCMSASWPNGIDRLYYCGFCHVWYGGRSGELVIVPNPNQEKIDARKIEDPVPESEGRNDGVYTTGEVAPQS